MALPQSCLSWASMTATVNEIKSPNVFLQQLLFSRHQSFPTEIAELSILRGDRTVAPLIRKDSEAVMVDAYTDDFVNIGFPNIRLKRPQTASEAMFTRRPGTVIFPSSGQQLSAIEQLFARDLQAMADKVTNTVELMVSEALTGVLAMQGVDGYNFQIDYDRPAAHDLSASVVWSDSSADPFVDFLAAKRLVNDEHGLPITHAIMASDAAAEFIVLDSVKAQLDNRRITAGQLDLTNSFNESGAIFLGRIYGVDVWEYGRSLDGQALVAAGTVQLVSATPGAENWLYFGAIPDMDALGERLFVGERFSKSWIEKDPSIRQLLLHTRPIPMMRRPGSVVTLTV